jgi:hypothetical protein
MGMFPNAIRAAILNSIQQLLQMNNPYVHVYMHAGETLRKEPSKEFNIVLKSNVKKDRTKNKPTSNEIAVLMVENDQGNISKRDVIIKKRNAQNEYHLQYINENLHFYDPLAYPLMHIFGESGWLKRLDEISNPTPIDHGLPNDFF